MNNFVVKIINRKIQNVDKHFSFVKSVEVMLLIIEFEQKSISNDLK